MRGGIQAVLRAMETFPELPGLQVQRWEGLCRLHDAGVHQQCLGPSKRSYKRSPPPGQLPGFLLVPQHLGLVR